ncbi:NAD(P)/FAD-dependent oxidoreductase [Gemmatimonas groenlandica]|uniref:FAD-binding oxidoreductase n=1 Tax=Gemmatimonas groenlandica TaxID=2732249 RepID=A0A6M4IP37_9BACT|nr:FAD-binding oxidoreductase [Gemmatimonas groenlandica]QJR35698.1 FAD-binding oxidoreductase [Gemmatimonas groenlandica]
MTTDNQPVWDDGTWTAFPSLQGAITTGTCVIGLGGSGLTVIDELLARGEAVVGLDASDVAAGAAGRNGGFLLAGAYDFYHDAVRKHGRDRAFAIYQATLVEMQRLAEAAPETVRFVGSRRIAADAWEIEDCRAQMDAMLADGLACEWYEAADGVGLTFPSDASFNPLARCRILARTAAQAGAQLFSRSPVTAVQGTRVDTAEGTVHCRRVIVAIDGRLEVLLPELTGRVRTARLQMLATAPTTEITVPCPMYYREGYEYWQQLPDGSLTIGGFRDQGGPSEWSLDARPTAPVQHLLESFVRTHLGVTAPITHRWAACAGYTESGLPVIEQVRGNVWALGGYSGTGNVIGALAARAVVSAALDGEPAGVRLLLGEHWSPDLPTVTAPSLS